MTSSSVGGELLLVLAIGCLAACEDNTTVIPPPNPQAVSVLTQHNDNTRAGWNDHETALTTSNVNGQQFGKVLTLAVDDQVYAQPLVVGHAHVNGGDHNVVLVATVNNTLYAFDGDDGTLYWSKNYTACGRHAIPT
jgi:outer membrane protein assembly factor BamB